MPRIDPPLPKIANPGDLLAGRPGDGRPEILPHGPAGQSLTVLPGGDLGWASLIGSTGPSGPTGPAVSVAAEGTVIGTASPLNVRGTGGVAVTSPGANQVKVALAGSQQYAFVYNPKTYGAVGNGVADDTAAIQAAIDAATTAGGGVVALPKGNYKVTSTLVVGQVAVSIIGVGSALHNLDAGGTLASESFGSLITWAGGASPVISTSRLNGAFWHSFAIDGGGLATYGMLHDRIQQCTMGNFRIARCLTAGMRLWVNTAVGSDDNCMWNSFTNFRCDRNPQGVILDGTILHGNCCHNHFSNFTCDHTANYGLDLIHADNNTFTNYYSFQRSPLTVASYGLRFGARAYNNYFFHSQGRAYAVATAITDPGNPDNYAGNVIFGYDKGNGQPLPTIESGARLDWTETGYNATGWHLRMLQLTNELTEVTVLDTTSTGGSHYVDARLLRNALSPIDRGMWIGWNSGEGGFVSLYAHLDEVVRIDNNTCRIQGEHLIVEDSDFTVHNSTGSSIMVLNNDTPGQQSGLHFAEGGVDRWELYKDEANNLAFANGMTHIIPFRIDKTTDVCSFENDRIRITHNFTPSGTAAAGLGGSIAFDNNYIYVCTDTNVWRRAPLSTW